MFVEREADEVERLGDGGVCVGHCCFWWLGGGGGGGGEVRCVGLGGRLLDGAWQGEG